ncbi:MAG: hypothetical protein SOY54_07665 [Bacilli bacterium]|nr:hypothetical protein [Bacilli bacterium]
MKIDNKKVDLFYDLVDSACMTYYEDIKRDYLEGFISFADALINGLNDSKLSNKAIKKLNSLIDKIEKEEFLNEEVRLASELVFIKGFKNKNMSLDFLTPDAINYIFSFVCNTIISHNYQNKKVTIMDTVLGAGNLLQTIMNNAKTEVCGIGIEKDELLARLAKSLSEIIDNDIIVNLNDAKNANNSLAEIIVGDFGESKEIYDIILKRLDNLQEKGYFVYLINNDFFINVPKNFREDLVSRSTLLGLIVLPQKFVSKGHIGKSIIIGKKEILKDYQMSVITINDDLSENNMEIVMNKINKMFE